MSIVGYSGYYASQDRAHDAAVASFRVEHLPLTEKMTYTSPLVIETGKLTVDGELPNGRRVPIVVTLWIDPKTGQVKIEAEKWMSTEPAYTQGALPTEDAKRIVENLRRAVSSGELGASDKARTMMVGAFAKVLASK